MGGCITTGMRIGCGDFILRSTICTMHWTGEAETVWNPIETFSPPICLSVTSFAVRMTLLCSNAGASKEFFTRAYLPCLSHGSLRERVSYREQSLPPVCNDRRGGNLQRQSVLPPSSCMR